VELLRIELSEYQDPCKGSPLTIDQPHMKKENKCSCIICKKEVHVRGFDTHWMRIHGTEEEKSRFKNSGTNIDYTKVSATISKLRKENREKLLQEYNANPKYCIKCGTKIKFANRDNKTCSRTCANSKEHSSSTKAKISRKIKQNTIDRHGLDIGISDCGKFYLPRCIYCNTTFKARIHSKRYCFKRCRLQCEEDRRMEDVPEKTAYRRRCQFKFSLKDFPDEFEFSLVEKHGWYKAANKGNNPGGISRDHMISISYGFEHGIDPKIISHPANCQLLQHTDNFRKNSKCSITLEDLLKKIDSWNLKYPQL